MTVKVPSIPDIPLGTDPALRDILMSLRELLGVREGTVAAGSSSRFVTIADLVGAGLVPTGVIPDTGARAGAPVVSNAVSPPSSVVLSSGTSELLRLGDGSIVARILVTWVPSPSATAVGYEYQFKKTTDIDWAYPLDGILGAAATSAHILGVQDGVQYDVRLRTYDDRGNVSVWVVTPGHLVLGKTALPADVVRFSVGQNGNVTIFQWDQVADIDLAGYEIRYGTLGQPRWDAAIPLTKVTRGTQVTSAALPPGNWTVMLKARDTSGNYSANAAIVDFTMVNTHDVVLANSQQPDWPGTLTNFVRHWTGVLVPDDQHTAAYYGWEVFDLYVPTPYAVCSYETAELDLGFSYSVRAWMALAAGLGPGAAGFPNPQAYFDYRVSGAYDGYELWTINNVQMRYAKAKFTLNTADGVAYVSRLEPTMDVLPHEERLSGFVVAAGGTAYSFAKRFYTTPSIQMTAQSSSGLRVPEFHSATPTGCTFHIHDGSYGNVGGTVDIVIRGD